MRKKTTEELVAAKPSPEGFAKMPKMPITIVVDGIRSLDNVGLLFRLSDGFRIQKLILCGITGYPARNAPATTLEMLAGAGGPVGMPNDDRPAHIIERHDRRIKKTAIQTIPFVEWEYRPDVTEIMKERKSAGDQIVVLEQTDASTPYTDVDYRFPLTLVVGHERTGVSDAVLSLADHIIEIPMHGMGNSHNVAIATTILLSHLHPLAIKES